MRESVVRYLECFGDFVAHLSEALHGTFHGDDLRLSLVGCRVPKRMAIVGLKTRVSLAELIVTSTRQSTVAR